MKKVLFATTALVAFAGAAAAEISISGTAEMGFADTNAPGSDVVFHNSTTLNFSMTGETDTGLAFGATYRFDMDGTSDHNESPVGDNETVWISGAFGKLTLGDTDGGFDWAMQEAALAGGTLTDDETAHAGYNGNSGLDGSHDDQVLRYEYAMGDFAAAISAELRDATTEDNNYGLGLRYNTAFGGTSLSLGLGYQTGTVGAKTALATPRSEGDVIGLSVGADFGNGFEAVVGYSSFDLDAPGADFDHTYIGAAYTTGALTLAANYGIYDADNGNEADGFALLANYDLGGGAVLQAGYGSGEINSAGSSETYSLGMAFSF